MPPLKPEEITYGTTIVEGIDVATNAQGFVSEIKDTKQGSFSAEAVATLANPGTDLLVFIHGFDNTFSDAVSRAAFNREWLAASGLPGTNTTVVAFSWPSSGRVVGYPVPADAYLTDQNMARSSGMALMRFMANLEPIIRAAALRNRMRPMWTSRYAAVSSTAWLGMTRKYSRLSQHPLSPSAAATGPESHAEARQPATLAE